jgi:transposase
MVELRARPKGRKEKLQRLVGDIRDRHFEYQARPRPPRDWARYDEAQAHELADILDLINHLLDPLPAQRRTCRPGRPPTYLAKDLAKVILLQTFFGTSNRTTAGYARIFREKLRLSHRIHYKAIERAYASAHVMALIHDAFTTTVEIGTPTTTDYTLDGSGIRTTIKGNWAEDKNSQTAITRFDGAITMVALPTQIITAFVPRQIGFTSEVNQLPYLVEKTVRITHSLRGFVTADAGFQSRANCEAITAANGTPRILPRRLVSLKTLGAPSWTRMLNQLMKDPQQWLHEYHKRSLAETSWSLYVRLFPRPLRRRLPRHRAGEHLARFSAFNLVRISRAWRQGVLPGFCLPRGGDAN